MGKTEKGKENHQTQMTKIPKTKRRKYGMNEKLDSILQNLHLTFDWHYIGQK